MKINANFNQEVNIEPVKVMILLRKNILGNCGWVTKEKEKYYKVSETGGGLHSWNKKEEITKALYDYIKALELVENYINNI